MVDPQTVASLLGVLGVGSLLGQYIAAGSQRRQTRADVLRALATVELARWVGPDEGDNRPHFRVAMRDLEASALVARVPRGVLLHYRALALASWMESYQRWDEEQDPEWGGSVPSWLADAVREAAGELNRVVWRPWLGRVGSTSRIAAQLKVLRELEAGGNQRAKTLLERALSGDIG